jgi:hypothetical protein
MLVINKGGLNIWAVQVQELAIEKDYFFVFTNLQTREVTKSPLTESVVTDRYTRFELTDPTDIDLEVGEYQYQIYDNNTESLLLEIGKLIVI